MGLFSSKPKRNLLDILGFQVNLEMESKLVEISKEIEFTDYEINIEENFKLFDKVIFRIFGHKKDLSGESQFNMLFKNDGQSLTIEKIEELVNAISNEYGKDRNGKSVWHSNDDNDILTYWAGRSWIIDKKGNVHINLNWNIDEGIDFYVLTANRLIK